VLKYLDAGNQFFLTISEGINDIGRAKQCHLQIHHKSISRWHARVILLDESIWLDDLESTNGTFHNGRKLESSVHLEAGDMVQFGDIQFKLSLENSRPDTRTTEAIEFFDATPKDNEDPVDNRTGLIPVRA